MYKVQKRAGTSQNVSVLNDDTGASVMLGSISIPMLDILKRAGHSFEDGSLDRYGEWDMAVSDECGKDLARLAMKGLKKPDRRKKQSEQAVPEPEETDNSKIDAMDVLLGLAKYK